MHPVIYNYRNLKVKYKLVGAYFQSVGEALVFIILENNFQKWTAEVARKDFSDDDDIDGPAPLPNTKFTSKDVVGSGRVFGGFSAEGIERFNVYVDMIDEFNGNTVQVREYGTLLNKECKQLRIANKNPGKRIKICDDVEDTPPRRKIRCSLPHGMTAV